MTSTQNDTDCVDSVIKDISLAGFGRKEITIAEHEMPGLMTTREKYAPAKPLAGARLMGSLHMPIPTAGLTEPLLANYICDEAVHGVDLYALGGVQGIGSQKTSQMLIKAEQQYLFLICREAPSGLHGNKRLAGSCAAVAIAAAISPL